ncbi:threonylcarbamoyl-AMP synthase [bacterium G20]|nr:threonylcarbamoyl-AMP synthase [bacterium G20]
MSYITDSFDEKVIELLKSGSIGFMPSDTIYGLSCLALNNNAVERIHKLKDRSSGKPFIVLISDTAQLKRLGVISTEIAAALRYWPGPLTIISGAEKAPSWLHLGTKTLAVRQPDNQKLLELMKKTGPLISTSANIAGQKPIDSVAEAQKVFGEKLDFYIDAGVIKGKPSTIIKKNSYKFEVIRQGAVKFKEI